MLARKLCERGVQVDMLTTTTRDFQPLDIFYLGWPNDYSERTAEAGEIRIGRQPASFTVPRRLGHAITRCMVKRWRREERRCGLMVRGSRNVIDYYHQRAIERPLRYDLMTALTRGPHSLGLLKRLATVMRNYDAVQVGFTPFAVVWQVVVMARILRKPVVVLALFHPQDRGHHFRWIYWAFAHADAVLAQTQYSAALLRRLAPGCNPVDVGAGVDLAELADGKVCGARFRKKYALDDRKIVLLVGRKETFKRYDLAIEALNLIGQERIRLVMIGRDIDGLPVSSPYVTVLGELERQDLIDAYEACDVFLLPSENESFGMVFLEAWARRKPVIGNRSCSPVACLIDDGENGYLSSSAPEIARRIVELIDSPELSRMLGQAGYDKVVRRYTWDAIAARVHELYLRLGTSKLYRPSASSMA